MKTTIDYEDESKTKIDIETVNDRWIKMFKKYAKKYPEDIQLVGQTDSSVTYSVLDRVGSLGAHTLQVGTVVLTEILQTV